jgi:hypothetical protein
LQRKSTKWGPGRKPELRLQTRLSEGGGNAELMMAFSGTKCIHVYSARHDIYPVCLGN